MKQLLLLIPILLMFFLPDSIQVIIFCGTMLILLIGMFIGLFYLLLGKVK